MSLQNDFPELERVLQDEKIACRLRADIECLNEAYGSNRNLETDLGGYVIVLWGTQEEIEKHFKSIMKYHNLNADEYEYFDKMVLPERDEISVAFRLFLCSSDYAVEIVTIETVRRYKEVIR